MDSGKENQCRRVLCLELICKLSTHILLHHFRQSLSLFPAVPPGTPAKKLPAC